MSADNERGRCSCDGSIPAPLAIAAAAAARHLGAGGVPEESLSQPSIARVVSAEAFKDDNYARVQSQLGVFLQMRSLPTAATGREMVLMTAAHGGPVRQASLEARRTRRRWWLPGPLLGHCMRVIGRV